MMHLRLIHSEMEKMKTNKYNHYFSGKTYKEWEKAPGKDVLINALKYFKKKTTHFTSILDVGCGTGYFLNRVYNEVSNDLSFYGVDISNTAIEKGKILYPNFNLECGDAHKIKSQLSQKFDCIVSYGSFEHFSKPGIAIKEASRLLLKSGIILTMQPTLGVYRTDRKDEGWYEETDNAKQMQWNLTRSTWEQYFTGVGIELFDIQFSKKFGALKPGNFYFGIRNL